MDGVRAVVWKEWRSLTRFPGGRWRLWFSVAMPVAFFALASPAIAGPEWVDQPDALFIAVIVPAVVAMMVTPDAFAGERERRTLATLLAGPLSDRAILVGKTLLPIAIAWGTTIATIGLALVEVNLLNRGQGVLLPSATRMIGAVAISLVISVLVVGAGVLASLRADTVQQAQQMVAVTMMVPGTLLGMAFTVLLTTDPDLVRRWFSGWSANEVLLVAGAVLVAADVAVARRVTRRFRRDLLVTDAPARA